MYASQQKLYIWSLYLTKEAFIATLRSFVSCRGKPSHVYSDNGTSFVGGNNELVELGRFFAQKCKNLGETMKDLRISWHFIPSYSPHFGRLWKAGVKTTKYHLKKVVRNALLTFEELYTFLTQVEALLNSRLLTPLSSDPNDLAPAHFLIGRTFTSVVDPSLDQRKRDCPTGREFSSCSKTCGYAGTRNISSNYSKKPNGRYPFPHWKSIRWSW